MSHIQHLVGHPRFMFIRHDVNNPNDLQALLESWRGHGNGHLREAPRLDYVLHLASLASPIDYARHPIHKLKIGSLATYHALGLAKAHKSVFLINSTEGDSVFSTATRFRLPADRSVLTCN